MGNSTDYEFLLQNSYYILAFGCTVLITIVGSIGAIGNISIIGLYFFRIKDSGERYFIPLLAIVDLLACVTSIINIVVDKANFYTYPSEFACRILCMLRVFLPGISAFIFFLISVQRYVLICKPLTTTMTLFRKRLLFALACGITMAGTLPILGISGIETSEETYMNNNVTVRMCRFSVVSFLGTMVYFGILLFAILGCIIATIYLYIRVLNTLNITMRVFSTTISNIASESENMAVRKMKSMTPSNTAQIEMNSMTATDALNASEIQLPDPKASQGQPVRTNVAYSDKLCADHPSYDTLSRQQNVVKDKSKSEKRKRRHQREIVQKRLTIMFFLLVLIYIISYIPPLVILILTYSIENFNFTRLSKTEALLWIYLPHLVLLNHVINPFIYGYYDTEFRKQLVSCFIR